MAKQVNFQRDDDEVRFVLESRRTRLVGLFYSASSLKQQCAHRHVVPLGHIILILVLNPLSTTPEASTLITITQLMRLQGS